MTAEIWIRRLSVLGLCAAAGLALSACGVRGGLERPAPLWGEPREAAPDVEDEDEDAEDEADDFLDPDDWDAPG
ncbi:MAG: argininosuccinate lyase [Oceanicaulis sp.]|nr:argininosuccinate lyase [Oceanicaulis sp.]